MSGASGKRARRLFQRRERFVYGSFTDALGQRVEVVHYRSPSGFTEGLRAEWTVDEKVYHYSLSVAAAAERIVEGTDAIWNDGQPGSDRLDNAVSDLISEPFGDYQRYVKPDARPDVTT